MRLLFDENMPVSLAAALVGHACDSVITLGWRGIKNGELLRRAESEGFDTLITLDADMAAEQSMAGLRLCVLVLRLGKQGKAAVLELAPELLRALDGLVPGEIRTIARHG